MAFEKFASSRASDFIVQEELFRSQSGGISRVLFKFDKKLYVLKEIIVSDAKGRRNAVNEVNLLQQLNHPNVVKFHGHFWDDSRRNGVLSSLFIVLEYCECGDLGGLIATRRKLEKPLEEAYIWRMFYQICLGVQHLHQNGIVHRDLKGLNILLTNNGHTAKVADLGVSRQVAENESMLQTFQGTPLYLSPELVDGSHYTEKTDIWSLGIILYELCMLTPPFQASSLTGLAQAIKAGNYPPLSPQYSPSLSRVIACLLNQDYKKRPNIRQLIERVEHHTKPESSLERSEKIVRPLSPPKRESPRVELDKSEEQRKEASSSPADPSKSPPPSRSSDSGDKKAVFKRRSILDEVRMEDSTPNSRAHPLEVKPDQYSKATHPNEDPSGRQDDHGLPEGHVRVDMNRLRVHERRERNVLRKLLQAKDLLGSTVNEVIGSSHRSSDSKQSGSGDDTTQSSEGNELLRKIEKANEVIAILEEAISQEGIMTSERAARCNIPLGPAQSRQQHPSAEEKPNSAQPARRDKSWGLSVVQQVERQETPPEISICHGNSRETSKQDVFRENKREKKALFPMGQCLERPRSAATGGGRVGQSNHRSRESHSSRPSPLRPPEQQHPHDHSPHPHDHLQQPQHSRRQQHPHDQPHHQQQPQHSRPHTSHAAARGSRGSSDAYGCIFGGSEPEAKPSTSMNSRQHHRVSHLSPSRRRQKPPPGAKFNIISGAYESA